MRPTAGIKPKDKSKEQRGFRTKARLHKQLQIASYAWHVVLEPCGTQAACTAPTRPLYSDVGLHKIKVVNRCVNSSVIRHAFTPLVSAAFPIGRLSIIQDL